MPRDSLARRLRGWKRAGVKLTLFSDRRYLPTGAPPVELLYPFWGRPQPRPEWEIAGTWDDYLRRAPEFFTWTNDPAAADVAVLPSDWKYYHRTGETERARAFARVVRPGGKLLVFLVSDHDEPVSLPGAIVLRASLQRSRQAPYEFALPGWTGDLAVLHAGGGVPPRAWQPKPVVGFCGHARRPLRSRVKRTLVRLVRGSAGGGEIDPLALRARSLDVLAASPRVTANFVRHAEFFAGSVPHGRWHGTRGPRARAEFLQNIATSDYVVCVRGGGNYSVRLYETLLCGRIPIFIDTDCALPWPDIIDWRELGVWCDAREVDSLGEKVAAFHARWSPAEFVARQQTCRRLWVERLSPAGFFAHLHTCLRS